MTELRLFLLRHGKSAWNDAKLADFDRPLAPRGEREATQMATLIAARAYHPRRIFCSSAQRTRETLGLMLRALPGDSSIEITRQLYEANAERLLSILWEQRNVDSVMLVGHNPGLHQLAQLLAGAGDDKALHRLRTDFPPASLAVMAFAAVEWSDIRPGAGHLLAFETPSR